MSTAIVEAGRDGVVAGAVVCAGLASGATIETYFYFAKTIFGVVKNYQKNGQNKPKIAENRSKPMTQQKPTLDTDHCPAETYGYIPGCRTCKHTGGGPSKLCVIKRNEYFRLIAKKNYTKDEA